MIRSRPCSSSQLIQFPRQFFIRQFSPLRLRHQLLRLGYGGAPLVYADLASLFSDLQAVVGPVVFPLGWGVVGAALGFLAVSAHLAAGALGLAGDDAATVAGVVPSGQEEIAKAGFCRSKKISTSTRSAKKNLPL